MSPPFNTASFYRSCSAALLIWRSPLVGRIIDAVPQQWLVSVQVYRALGVIFLILYANGQLPGLFAWPAGVGDVLVGVLAPIIGLAYARDPKQNGDLVAGFNLFGLADLAIAISTGFLTAPSLAQPFAVEPPNELIASTPSCSFRFSSCRCRYFCILLLWQSSAGPSPRLTDGASSVSPSKALPASPTSVGPPPSKPRRMRS